eukprot:g6381.t1
MVPKRFFCRLFLPVLVAATCDYRLVEESKYSSFSVHSLGLSVNRSICMNDYFSTSHNDMTLKDVIDASNDTIRTNALKIAEHAHNGTNTTSLIILDVEYPVQYNQMWFQNDTMLADIVLAVRRRVQITRQLFPRAPVALYDEQCSSNKTVIAGYRRAAALGLWDDVTYLVPVLYLGSPAQNATNHTNEVLTSTAAGKMTSRGGAIPMAPLLSWKFFPSDCAVPFDSMHDILRAIEQLSAMLPPQPTPIPVVHLWSGKDNETSAQRSKDNKTCVVPPIAQRDWLERARVVPQRCLPGCL